MKASQIHSSIRARDVRPFAMDGGAMSLDDVRDLSAIGINLHPGMIRRMYDGLCQGVGMDDLQALVTTASIATPLQFLQNWLPGIVNTITGARKIDDIIGIQTVGNFEDEEIVQKVLEPTGKTVPYGDYTNIPLASWNLNFERRTVVRNELGFAVGILEDLRSGRVSVNDAAEKRGAVATSLEITRNRIGFLGYATGANRTYGFLNDPLLPAYENSGNVWSTATFLQITADVRGMLSRLRAASKDMIDPNTASITFAIASNAVDYLSVTNVQGTLSVAAWLKETYPNVRIVSAPELNDANGGADVAYMFADRVEDGSTDGGATWAQIVPAKFYALGVEKRAKSYVEDSANATAGAMLKRPYAVQRLTGIG